MNDAAHSELIRRFYEAFNSGDLNALERTLHPGVEMVTARGPRYGRDAARTWATPSSEGELYQRVVLEGVRVHDDRAVALIRRQWRWRDGRGTADEQELAALFEFRDGLIARVVTGEDRAAALAAAGIEVSKAGGRGRSAH